MNNKSLLKNNLCLLFFSIFCLSIYAQDLSNPDIANRQTAIRCIQVSKNYLVANNYSLALSQAELGLAYDDKISDLWYIKAVSSKMLDYSKKQILDYSEKFYEIDDWVIFSKDLGLVLYGEILSDCGEYEKAYQVLEDNKEYYSREIELIKAKAAYRLQDFTDARNIISSASKIFPEDYRFPYTFYKNEFYASYFNSKEIDAGAIAIANNFKSMNFTWAEKYKDVLFYASYFETDTDESNRMLLNYLSQGSIIPEAIIYALDKKCINENTAFEQFKNYSNTGLDYELFLKTLQSFTDEQIQISCISFLSKFNGVVTFDRNKDFIYDMKVFYDSGRPSIIEADFNQDDVLDWQIQCDFGTPVMANIFDKNIQVVYGVYPFIDTVELIDKTNYSLIADKYEWSPVNFVSTELINNFFFYYPIPMEKVADIDCTTLFSNSYRITTTKNNEQDEVLQIRFVLNNGLPVQAVYTKNSTPYANAVFEGGYLLYRTVDKNFDGSYELTEYYNFDYINYSKYQSEQEHKILYDELFGPIDTLEGLYLSKICIDENEDGKVECIEEYIDNGKKISWLNENNIESIIYEKKVDENNEIKENIVFLNPIDQKYHTIEYSQGKPTSVKSGDEIQKITFNDLYDLFWIGNNPGDDYTERLVQEVTNDFEQGKITLFQFEEFPSVRTLIIKIGDYYFAEVFSDINNMNQEKE